MTQTNTPDTAGKTGPRRTTGRTIPTILAWVGLLGAVNNLYGVTTPIYDTGGFEDPSNDRLHPTDRSQSWVGAFDLSNAKTLAESFSLQNNSVLDTVELWTYDTKDGSAGTLQQIQYAIYTGATQPTGAPIASGLGQITSSAVLDGHRSTYAEGDMVIQTVFNLVSPFHLAPDVIYWLALTGCTDPFGASNTAQWAEAGSGAVGGTYLVQTDTGWVSVAGDRAFELQGRSGANVPETGSTLAFLALTMMPLAGLRWMASKTLATSSAALAASALVFAPQALADRTPEAPQALRVPAGNKVAFHTFAIGVQIYVCRNVGTAAAPQYAWVFKAPEAVLFADEGGKGEVAIHYAGPTWESVSGSKVLGARVAGVTVDSSAIPWLLLRAVSTEDPGIFHRVTYIQRLNTTGGLAPTANCDAAHEGQEVGVPYTAEYWFYRQQN